MQQTILALGALMTLMLLTVQQQRSSFMVMEGMYLREIENAAADFAQMRAEAIIGSMSFDESRVGTTDLDVDTGTLTASGALGPEAGESDASTFDDLDDYHTFTETATHVLSADTFRFDVNYTVRYIDPTAPTAVAVTQTLAKEFTINVVSQDSIGAHAAQYTMSQTVIVSDDI